MIEWIRFNKKDLRGPAQSSARLAWLSFQQPAIQSLPSSAPIYPPSRPLRRNTPLSAPSISFRTILSSPRTPHPSPSSPSLPAFFSSERSHVRFRRSELWLWWWFRRLSGSPDSVCVHHLGWELVWSGVPRARKTVNAGQRPEVALRVRSHFTLFISCVSFHGMK